jgi:hypothetical protein
MRQRLFLKKMQNCVSMFAICSMVMIPVLYVSCDEVYDNIKEFSIKEIVYPAHFDTIYATSGYERIEIDLSAAGRVPASQMKLGKAKKTIVEYDTVSLVFDSICSWVNITGLTQPRLYRFKVCTADEHGNRSTPLEIALTPYTSVDREALAVPNPNIAAITPSLATVGWGNGLTSNIMEYRGLSYSYTDKDGNVRTGENWENSQFFVANIEEGREFIVNVRYCVIPRLGGKNILDSVYFEQPIVVNIANAPEFILMVSPDSVRISLGKSKVLTINLDYEVTWESSDNSIVTVVDGVITAHSIGTAIITAKSSVVANSATVKIVVGTIELYKCDKTGWTIKVSDQHNDTNGGAKMIDGDYNTHWHSNQGMPLPHWAVIDMKKPLEVGQIVIRRRISEGHAKTVQFFVGDSPDSDSNTWEKVAEGVFANNNNEGDVFLTLNVPNVTGRYLKLVLPDSFSNTNCTVREIDVYAWD